MHMGWRKWSVRTESMGETVSKMTDILSQSARYAKKARWGLYASQAPDKGPNYAGILKRDTWNKDQRREH